MWKKKQSKKYTWEMFSQVPSSSKNLLHINFSSNISYRKMFKFASFRKKLHKTKIFIFPQFSKISTSGKNQKSLNCTNFRKLLKFQKSPSLKHCPNSKKKVCIYYSWSRIRKEFQSYFHILFL